MRRLLSEPVRPEDELMLWAAGTAERRREGEARARALLADVDPDALVDALRGEVLLGLLGARLEALATGALPASFHGRVRMAQDSTARWMLVVESMTRRATRTLEEEGVRCVTVKGPFMARGLHGDPGLRYCGDIDLLVGPRDFDVARGILAGLGWTSAKATEWDRGLPLFETELAHARQFLPPIDLHWRLHWYEDTFSDGVIARSRPPAAEEPRLPAPADVLALLLACYARDGFWGLRLAADVAAWWDVYGSRSGAPALARVLHEHPALGPALGAAAAVCERLVGVPAARIVGPAGASTWRQRRAVRLANWNRTMPPSVRQATQTLVDGLLTPSGGHAAFVRRHFLPPQAALTHISGLPEHARARRGLRRASYGAAVGAHVIPAQAQALWRTRGDRDLAQVPRR